MTLVRVTAVDYTTQDDEPVIKLTGRSEEGERRVHRIHGTRPYLYVKEDQAVPPNFEDRVIDIEPGYESFDGVPLERWTTKIPEDVRDIKDDDSVGKTWESDIPYYRRASIDFDLSGYVDLPDERNLDIEQVDTSPQVSPEEHIEPRIVYGDIEVLMGSGSVDDLLEEAKQPIVAITLYDSYREVYDVYALDKEEQIEGGEVREYLEENDPEGDPDIKLHRAPTEEVLLDSFLGYFEKYRPDLTTGWNWVDFDILYLIRRIKRLHTESNNLDLNRWSDAGYTKKNVRDYHGDLARAVVGVPAMDLMKLFFERIEYTEWRSQSLDYVAQQLLGRGKIPGVNVNRTYEKSRSELIAYNLIDVELCHRIDEERDILDTVMGLAEESQVQIYDTFSEMRLVDGYIMARADDDEVLPPQKDEEVPENAGGLVLEPSDGVAEWVGVMDLKSLYPSSMITWNISPETVDWMEDFEGEPDLQVPWVPEASDIGPGKPYSYPVTEEDVTWDKLGTRLDEQGLVPKYLKLLFQNREEAKAKRNQYEDGTMEYETWDRKQYGIKVLMNSFYGVSSNDHWRLAKPGLGDAITSASRYALFKGQQIVQRMGYETIYGDTDSVFVSLKRDEDLTERRHREKAILDAKGLTNQINTGMEEAIRDSGLEGDHPHLDGSLPHEDGSHCLMYEFEKLYRRYIQFGKKKRYAGHIIWKEGEEADKVDVTGFESERADTPELAAQAQKEVLHMVLSGADFEEVGGYVSNFVDSIRAEDIELARIARPRSLSKEREEYDSVTQTLRACDASAEELGKSWRKGDDPFLVFLRGTPVNTPDYDVMALEWGDDLPEGYEIDAEEHIRIALQLPLEPILNELGWAWKEVKTGVKRGNAMEGDWGSTAEEDENGLTGSGASGRPKSQEGEGDIQRDSPPGKAGTPDSGGSGGALEDDW